MKISKVVDIEEFLRVTLAGFGYSASIPPHHLEYSDVPAVLITRVGGQEKTEVSTIHSASIDCYAQTDAQALELANMITAIIRALPYADTSTQVYEAGFSAPPYLNPDPNHPNIPRATCTCNLHLKDVVSEI